MDETARTQQASLEAGALQLLLQFLRMLSVIKDHDHESCTIELLYVHGELLLLVLMVGISISASYCS
jgi:hypothetical protein